MSLVKIRNRIRVYWHILTQRIIKKCFHIIQRQNVYIPGILSTMLLLLHQTSTLSHFQAQNHAFFAVARTGEFSRSFLSIPVLLFSPRISHASLQSTHGTGNVPRACVSVVAHITQSEAMDLRAHP